MKIVKIFQMKIVIFKAVKKIAVCCMGVFSQCLVNLILSSPVTRPLVGPKPNYVNTPMQYTAIITGVNVNFQMKNSDIFLIFAQHRWWVHLRAVLTSIHNLCFGAKMRKIKYTHVHPVLLYKSGV